MIATAPRDLAPTRLDRHESDRAPDRLLRAVAMDYRSHDLLRNNTALAVIRS